MAYSCAVPPGAEKSEQPRVPEQAEGPKHLEPLRSDDPDVSVGWNESEAVRAAASMQLPADLLAEGVGRLRGLTLVAAAVLAVYLGALALFVPSTPEWLRMRGGCLTLLGVGAALSLAAHGMTRIEKLKPQHAHD